MDRMEKAPDSTWSCPRTKSCKSCSSCQMTAFNQCVVQGQRDEPFFVVNEPQGEPWISTEGNKGNKDEGSRDKANGARAS